jgi:hypothetical protein
MSAVCIINFGADPKGISDSAVAINNAINSLPPGGGDVIFPPGDYLLKSTVNIGNGSSATRSTKRGVRLLGQGVPSWPVGDNKFGDLPTNVQLNWGGAVNGLMISVNGPLQGWGVENMLLMGKSVAGAGLNVRGASNGQVRNLSIMGQQVGAIMSRPVVPFASGYPGCEHNYYENVNIEVPAFAYAKGIYLGIDGTPTPVTDDTFYSTFINLEVELVSTTLKTYGIYLEVCDGNVFYNTGVQSLGGLGAVGIVFDYSKEGGGYPNGNGFFGLDIAGFAGGGKQIETTGNATISAMNYIYGMATSNGMSIPHAAGVVHIGPNTTQTTPVPFNALPPSSTGTKGMRSIVSNSSTTGFNTIVKGTGTTTIPVWNDGTNWRVG